eukprot:7837191-Lingulodinium_polyedra.AAC.1
MKTVAHLRVKNLVSYVCCWRRCLKYMGFGRLVNRIRVTPCISHTCSRHKTTDLFNGYGSEVSMFTMVV